MAIQPLTSLRVLLIGDTCIDEYKIGTIDRLSPEAPVPVIKIVEEYSLPGMASNVYNNLKNLGLEPDFVHNKEQILKTRYIDKRSGQHLLRVDSEPTISTWNEYTLYPLEQYHAVIISDYNKGFLSYETIENIIRTATGPVFIDTKKTDLQRFNGSYVKINEYEYRSRSSANDHIIITMGDKGAVLKTPNQEIFVETKPVDVVDVCGCGDTFLAALVYKFLITNDMIQSIKFANIAAGLTVQKQGNYAPTLEEIENGY